MDKFSLSGYCNSKSPSDGYIVMELIRILETWDSG